MTQSNHAISEDQAVVHTLPQALLDAPLKDRFSLALQQWLDLHPGSTQLRFGKVHDGNDYYLAENLYGPRLLVMTNEEYWDNEFKGARGHREDDEKTPKNIAKKAGVHLREWMASDPSVELFYEPREHLQYDFRTELVEALNYGLGQIGCRTHSVKLSDHTPQFMKLYNKYWNSDFGEDTDELSEKMNALKDYDSTIVWQKKDAFAKDVPPATVFEALTKYFADAKDHPVTSHVTIGETIDTKTLDDSKWTPMSQTEAERIVMKAKADLSNPENPWAKTRASKDDAHSDQELYAYIVSQQPVPIARNGHLIYKGMRFNAASEKSCGYVVVGSESCGSGGIERDCLQLLGDAGRGDMSQVQMTFSDLPDAIVSTAYHAQVRAHQQERANWLREHPQATTPGQGPVMTKAVSDLQVGDQIGVSSQPDGMPDLWCDVTKREGNVVTLFIQNGHWDFQLDTSTNKSLPHDIVANLSAHVVYTAPIPIKDGALYTEALEYMREHAESQQASPQTPTV